MGEEVEQGRLRTGLALVEVEVGQIRHAVFGEEGDGVIAEAGVEGSEFAWKGGVDTHFKHAPGFDGSDGELRRVVGEVEKKALDLGDEFSVRFRGFLRGDPYGIGKEGFPGGFSRCFVRVGEEIDQGVTFVFLRYPVNEIGHAVFFKQHYGMVPKAGVEGFELALARVVGPEFKAGEIGGVRRREEKTGEKESESSKDWFHVDGGVGSRICGLIGSVAMKNPAPPSDKKRDASEGGDRAESADVSQSQRIKASGEKNDPCEEPAVAERSAGKARNYKKGEAMDEVVEGRGFPIVEAARLFEAIRKSVGSESAKRDPEKNDKGSEAEAGGRGHSGNWRELAGIGFAFQITSDFAFIQAIPVELQGFWRFRRIREPARG